MKKIGMRIMTAAATAAAIAVSGCGGGGGGGGKGSPATETPRTYYSDVRGYSVAAGAEAVEVGRWPSWRQETGLVAACASGEAFYGDRCWQRVVVDTDTMVVTFEAGAESTRLAIGEVLPEVLGTLAGSSEIGGCRPSALIADAPTWACGWPHHANVGYVGMAGPVMAGVGFPAGSVWDMPVEPTEYGRQIIRSPWAIGSQIDFEHDLVAGFLVKTTFLYGFRATKPTPLASDYELVHNWPYAGEIVVSGTHVPLPARLATIATAAGTTISTDANGSKYVDLRGHTVRLVSDRYLVDARNAWGGAGTGLSESDLVTSVELHSRAVYAP